MDPCKLYFVHSHGANWTKEYYKVMFKDMEIVPDIYCSPGEAYIIRDTWNTDHWITKVLVNPKDASWITKVLMNPKDASEFMECVK